MATLSAGLSTVDGWQLLELQSYNLIHQARRSLVGAPNWDDRIVVIAIDDASTAQLGRFPWPRQTYTDLLERLRSTQPAVITFDVLFPDSTEEDGGLAKAIVDNANVVLAIANRTAAPIAVSPTIAEAADGFFLTGDISHKPDIDGISRSIQLYSQANPSLSVATLQVYMETMANTAQASTPQASTPQASTPQANTHLASSPSSTDPHDAYSDPQALSPSIFSRSSTSQSFKFGVAWVKRFSDRIPDDETRWVSWPGEIDPPIEIPDGTRAAAKPQSQSQKSPSGYLQTYSYVDVLEGRIDSRHFQNKIVLIGATAPGIDPLRTPFQSRLPTAGIYLHAATIDNLLNNTFLKRPPKWQRTLLLAVLAIASIQLLQHQGVYRRLAVMVGFPLAWSGFAYGSFLLGWWLPVAAPLCTVALSGLVIQLREQQEKQQLMDIFSMNVSPGTAELIWQHKDAILHRGELAAQTLTATVLFMDIRGFSSIAETLPSQQLLPWLNQYFETMTDCIMEHGGMVDKYIGDAIMAVFGAPLPRSSTAEIQADAIAALTATLEMHDRLKALNLQLARQNLPTIDFGIGIHTGLLIGGTVGSRYRLNYSVFGDTVNIAARLESMTKALPKSAPFRLLISADTCQYTQAQFPVQLFQSGNLRGRKSSTDVYTLIDSAISPLPPTAKAPEATKFQPALDAPSATA